MRKEQKEIIKLTSAKLLLSLFGAVKITAKPFFKASPIYRKSVYDFEKSNIYDKSEINERIQYLKRMKLIKTFVENREKYAELQPAGFKKLKQLSQLSKESPPTRPKKWDRKWWLTVFDVPEKFRTARDSLRFKLQTYDFVKIQKSVYVFPFPCTDEVVALSKRLGIEKYVTIMIAEIIQGEENIIHKFLVKGILKKSDLKY